MPEFEETQHRTHPANDYKPGTELEDPSKATPAADNQAVEEPAIEGPKPKRVFPEDAAQPEPSAEMLTRIQEIESRLAGRKTERAQRNDRAQARDKSGAAEKPRSRSGARPKRSSSDDKQRSSGKERTSSAPRRKTSGKGNNKEGLVSKLKGFIGGLFSREQPLPPEPELPAHMVRTSKAPADRGDGGNGRRRSGKSGRSRGGNGSSRGANNSRHRGRSANRRDDNKDIS